MINYIASAGPHISVKVDEVFNIAGVSITNSHLVGILGLVALVWLMFRTRAAVLGKKKHNFATMLAQWTFDGLYNTVLLYCRTVLAGTFADCWSNYHRRASHSPVPWRRSGS